MLQLKQVNITTQVPEELLNKNVVSYYFLQMHTNAFFKIGHHSNACILVKTKVYISTEENKNENRIFPILHSFQGHLSTYF